MTVEVVPSGKHETPKGKQKQMWLMDCSKILQLWLHFVRKKDCAKKLIKRRCFCLGNLCRGDNVAMWQCGNVASRRQVEYLKIIFSYLFYFILCHCQARMFYLEHKAVVDMYSKSPILSHVFFFVTSLFFSWFVFLSLPLLSLSLYALHSCSSLDFLFFSFLFC